MHTNDDAVDGLSEALRVYLEHKNGASAESDEQLLQRHAGLRELLEPLLAHDEPGSQSIRAGLIIGDYRLVESIGRGGMGEVWEAEQVSLKRRVALKVLRGHTFASLHALQRFRREALAGARIKHPCVVAVYAVGEQDGVHFIAQELVETRRTLSTALHDLRALPVLPPEHWRDTAGRFARLADALQVAHDSGVIHRDLKPSNILLAADGTPKIADFGLALVEGALELSRSGDLSGSPFYMSPEQAGAGPIKVDARSDVFSLGATLYEALTLSRPFDGDTVTQVLHKILVVDPPDPREIRSLCPRDLAVICLKMLEKEPARRYASMRDVADELRRFSSHQPIRARPSGFSARAAKWCRRHPVWAASSAIVCGALAVVSVLLIENQRARHAAETSSANAKAASDVAAREARTSGRVVDFLIDAFSASNPDIARGRQPTVREVLDRGVERIRSELVDAADASPRARLLNSLGLVYFRLGLHREAEALLREAHTLASAKFGADDSRTLEGAAELARVLVELSRPREGLPFAREVFDACERQFGLDDERTLLAESRLGSLEKMCGLFDDAEAHLRHALAGFEPLEMPTGAVLADLGEVMQWRGRFSEARTLLQRSIDEYSAQLGADAVPTINSLEALSKLEYRESHFERMTELLATVVNYRACVQGATHPDTLTSASTLATMRSLSDASSAIADLRGIYATATANLGPTNRTTVYVAKMLSAALAAGNRLDEAEIYAIDALIGLRTIGGHADPEMCHTLRGFSGLEVMLGHYEFAACLAEESLDLALLGSAPDPNVTDELAETIVDLRRGLGFDAAALMTARAWLARTPLDHPRRDERVNLVEQLEASVVEH